MLLRILLILVTMVKPLPNTLDGISKDTLVLSKMGVLSVVVVIGTFCTQIYDKWGLSNFLYCHCLIIYISSLLEQYKKCHVGNLCRTWMSLYISMHEYPFPRIFLICNDSMNMEEKERRELLSLSFYLLLIILFHAYMFYLYLFKYINTHEMKILKD